MIDFHYADLLEEVESTLSGTDMRFVSEKDRKIILSIFQAMMVSADNIKDSLRLQSLIDAELAWLTKKYHRLMVRADSKVSKHRGNTLKQPFPSERLAKATLEADPTYQGFLDDFHNYEQIHGVLESLSFAMKRRESALNLLYRREDVESRTA